MLEGAKRILELFDNDEFKAFIIQGDHGYGKTSYANTLISEVYSKDGVHGNWDIPLFKKHIGFHPKHVIDNWMTKDYRDKVYHWDDAGLWLHSLDYQDPFVKDVGKYMQVVRTDWSCVIFTAISKEDISSKIRSLRNVIIIDITKDGSGPTRPNRRTATAYIERKTWKGRPWHDEQWKEMFDSHVPGNYSKDNPEFVYNPTYEQKKNANVTWGFYGWYKPIRDKYAEMGKARMKKRADDHPDLKDDTANY